MTPARDAIERANELARRILPRHAVHFQNGEDARSHDRIILLIEGREVLSFNRQVFFQESEDNLRIALEAARDHFSLLDEVLESDEVRRHRERATTAELSHR